MYNERCRKFVFQWLSKVMIFKKQLELSVQWYIKHLDPCRLRWIREFQKVKKNCLFFLVDTCRPPSAAFKTFKTFKKPFFFFVWTKNLKFFPKWPKTCKKPFFLPWNYQKIFFFLSIDSQGSWLKFTKLYHSIFNFLVPLNHNR